MCPINQFFVYFFLLQVFDEQMDPPILNVPSDICIFMQAGLVRDSVKLDTSDLTLRTLKEYACNFIDRKVKYSLRVVHIMKSSQYRQWHYEDRDFRWCASKQMEPEHGIQAEPAAQYHTHSNITMLSLDLCPGHTIDCQFVKLNPIKVGRSVIPSLAIPLSLLV